jgi:DNA-directed RNA polymerase subunit beta'
VPHVYKKFVAQLQASGINVVRKGSQTHLMALTDRDVDELAGDRNLENAETVDWRGGLAPKAGGLFDKTLTGSHGGGRWSAIPLHEPMVNPVFEEPVRRVLGLTVKKFEDILAGREELDKLKGPAAIQAALKKIDLPQALAQARADVQSGRASVRDAAVRKLGYLAGAERQGVHPSEWMLSRVPVLPPVFRPVSVMQGTGGQLVSDSNYLYKEVFDANAALKALSSQTDDVGEERLTLYKAMKGVTGLGDPVQPKNQERKVKGYLQEIFGSSPKFSVVSQKLLGTPMDLVGRATITPNPDLDMDQVGLPEAKAWDVYAPFVVRRLVRKGVPRVQALEYVQQRHDLAKKALLDEVGERPVIINRAPVLHRYGMMAFYPRLTKGDTLQMSPLIYSGFGADNDGDAMNWSVPASDEAKDEAVAKMLPSKNLISASKFRVHYKPTQEAAGGLHVLTSYTNHDKKPRVFATQKDAYNAWERGEMDPGDPVQVLGK